MKTWCNRQIHIADHRQTYATFMSGTPQINQTTYALYKTHPYIKKIVFFIKSKNSVIVSTKGDPRQKGQARLTLETNEIITMTEVYSMLRKMNTQSRKHIYNDLCTFYHKKRDSHSTGPRMKNVSDG